MSEEQAAAYTCPIATAVERVGDAWSLLILRDASRGATRFDQFRQSLGIAPNILSKRLAALVDGGVFAKHRYSEHPPRDEYRLTEAGKDFLPVLIAIGAWGQRHFDDGHMAALIDGTTGAAFDPVVVDRISGRPLLAVAPPPTSGVAATLERVDRLRLGGFDQQLVDAGAGGALAAPRGEGIE